MTALQLKVCTCAAPTCERCGDDACRCGAELHRSGEVIEDSAGVLVEVAPAGVVLACSMCGHYLAALGYPLLGARASRMTRSAPGQGEGGLLD